MVALTSTEIADLVGKTRAALSFIYENTPLSKIQERSLRDPGIKGPIWVSQAEFPAPEPEDNDARQLVDDAIRVLGRGDEQYTIPTLPTIRVEWTGYPVTTEREKFKNIEQNIKNQATIVYVFGGSFYLNSPASARPIVSKLVAQTGARCCTIGYRLAPQNPFPSALVDLLLAYLNLLYPSPNAYHSAIPASSIVLAGDSSGAGLILSFIQLILAARRTQSTDNPTVRFNSTTVTLLMPAGLTLISPAGDQAIALPSWKANAQFDIFSRDTAPLTSENYPSCPIWPSNPPRGHVYCDTSMLCHPLVSPAAARDWVGCPPLWVASGEERLADSGKVIVQTAARQGVVVRWEMYERMPHNWVLLFPKLWQSEAVLRRCAEVMVSTLGGKEMESKGDIVKVDGERKQVDVKTLTRLTADEVEGLMRANTEHLKPWTGSIKARSHL